MVYKIQFKKFSFALTRKLRTSQGYIKEKQGWLVCLKNKHRDYGWGEIAPFTCTELQQCESYLEKISNKPTRQELEDGIKIWPNALSFGVGAALAEIDSEIGNKTVEGWLPPPDSAVLISSIDSSKKEVNLLKSQYKKNPLTIKIKVALQAFEKEKDLVNEILNLLPLNSHLRLDANGGWNRLEAGQWMNLLKEEPRLEWLEQPLSADDPEGLLNLSKKIHVALDESLINDPSLRDSWKDWQIRRPLLEGDPRFLLAELKQGIGYKMISTAFETGIGRRWINHLSALQQIGPTPTAPGLAPGWCPHGPLFSLNPEIVWNAA